MLPLIKTRLNEIAALCRGHGVRRLDVFGSAARDADFDAARSDLDFLVEFEGSDPLESLRVLLDLQERLAALFGRRIDLIDRQDVEQSRNYLRRQRILEEAQPVYDAR